MDNQPNQNNLDQYHTTFEQVQRDRAVKIGPISLERERYNYYQEDPNKKDTYNRQVLRHNKNDSLLNQLFFSQKNLNIIQAMIRKKIYDRSNGQWLIDDQDETELVIIARSVFLQKSQNLPYNITEQIQVLNGIVSEEAATKVMSGIVQYKGYLKDASTLYAENPLPHPQNVSSAGTKLYSFTNRF